MSQTYADIYANADMEWKFQRTAFLTQFMDYQEFQAPPFNLVPRLTLLIELVRRLIELLRQMMKYPKRLRNKLSDVESDKSLDMNDEDREKVSDVESDKSLEMNDEDKKRYHHFEDVLHQRLLHRQLQDRSKVA